VVISAIEAMFESLGIDYIILDQNMSILEGSLGIIPRRIMVTEDDYNEAEEILREMGLEKEKSAK